MMTMMTTAAACDACPSAIRRPSAVRGPAASAPGRAAPRTATAGDRPSRRRAEGRRCPGLHGARSTAQSVSRVCAYVRHTRSRARATVERVRRRRRPVAIVHPPATTATTATITATTTAATAALPIYEKRTAVAPAFALHIAPRRGQLERTGQRACAGTETRRSSRWPPPPPPLLLLPRWRRRIRPCAFAALAVLPLPRSRSASSAAVTDCRARLRTHDCCRPRPLHSFLLLLLFSSVVVVSSAWSRTAKFHSLLALFHRCPCCINV